MKHFYTLFIATAVTLTASAQKTAQLHGIETSEVKTQTTRTIGSIRMVKVNNFDIPELNSKKHITTKGETTVSINDLAGDYTFQIGDYYRGQSSEGQIEATGTITVNGTTVEMDSEYFMSAITGTYNVEDNTITFDELKLGSVQTQDGTTYYVKLMPFYWETTDPTTGAGRSVYESFSATFTGTEVVFPAEHGFEWGAFSDRLYHTKAGSFDKFDMEGAVKFDPNADPNEGWTSVGTATFQDGWLLPCYGIDQTNAENHYEVELQQLDANKNVYRLVDPYHGDTPIVQVNESTKAGYIQFDVTDPNHVVFELVDAGFANANLEISKFYCYNALTYLAGNYNLTAAQVVEVMGDQMAYTTFANGVLTVPSSYEKVEPDEEAPAAEGENTTTDEYKWVNDACFGDQSEKLGGYGWIDQDRKPVNMEAKIFFPTGSEGGVDNVSVDNSKAPVKYYNMQGMELQQPARGSVVIRVHGTDVQKILVR